MTLQISGCVGVHPATRIFLCLCLLLVVPTLPAPALHGLALLALLSLPWLALARRYLWRTRWLLLMLLLILPWSTPGLYLWPHVWSPTREGALLALQQVQRCLLVLTALALALQGLDGAGRLRAFLGCLWPLARLGLPVERLAVRLVLTLTWLEQQPARRTWNQWLAAWHEVVEQSLPPQTIEIELGRWHWQDALLMLAGIAGAGCALGFNA